MAKSGRQTFKKRQKEMAKKQKREDKAKRLAARRGKTDTDEDKEKTEKEAPASEDGKPTLKIVQVGGSAKTDKDD